MSDLCCYGKFIDEYRGWTWYCLWDQRRPAYASPEWIEVVW